MWAEGSGERHQAGKAIEKAGPRQRGPLWTSRGKRNAFPRLAHRSAAAHKLHSTPQQHGMNLISGNGETTAPGGEGAGVPTFAASEPPRLLLRAPDPAKTLKFSRRLPAGGGSLLRTRLRK